MNSENGGLLIFMCMCLGCCHKLLMMKCAKLLKFWLMLKQGLENWYGSLLQKQEFVH